MAGLYAARGNMQVDIEQPTSYELEMLESAVRARIDGLEDVEGYGKRLSAIVYELVKRADAVGDDPHLAWELLMGAEGICTALEAQTAY